ncbi:MAG: hypothetical protein H7Y38_10555, partial [Armatimonadetes bacterium]|nr:hypothetical protein [Armatimonadota bacterium]
EGHDDVCLLESFPYNPAPQNTTEPACRKGEVALLFLSQSAAFARSYAAVWRGADYRRKVNALFKASPATSDANRLRRFFTLRMVYAVYEQTGDNRGIADAIAQMFALADDTANPEKQSELRLKALSHALDRARKTGDDSGFIEALAQSYAILAAAGGAAWVHGERHDLAHQLTMAGKYADALPLWEQNRATPPHGHANGWDWLLHAVTRWKVTGDRAATLDLLRHARATEQRDLRDLFLERPEFAPVRDDAEFLAAVSPVTPVQ